MNKDYQKEMAIALVHAVAALVGINIATPKPAEIKQDFNKADLFIAGHVENQGWDNLYKVSGDIVGTKGQAKRLEAVRIKIGDELKGKGRLKVTLHIQNIGDKVYIITDEAEIGTVGQALRIEAIGLEFIDGLEEIYDIAYQGHVEGQGDTGYVKNGALIGSRGKSLRLEAIQYAVIKK